MKAKNKDRARVLRVWVHSWDSRRPALKKILEDLQTEAVLEQVGSKSGKSFRTWGVTGAKGPLYLS